MRARAEAWLYPKFKRCVKKANLDPKKVWIHSFRKAFRKVVRKANLDDDFKEAIMGHRIPGSRENYFDRYDLPDLEAQYMKIDFSREIHESEYTRLRKENADLNEKIAALEKNFQQLWKTVMDHIVNRERPLGPDPRKKPLPPDVEDFLYRENTPEYEEHIRQKETS